MEKREIFVYNFEVEGNHNYFVGENGILVHNEKEFFDENNLDKLFDGEFGMGYPENEAERKRLEASGLKDLNQLTKRSWEELVEQLPTDTFTKLLQRKIVMNAIITNGTNEEFIRFLKAKIGKK